MSIKIKLLIVAAALVVVGVPLLLFADTKGPESALVCAEQGESTSGFKDSEQNCAISVESMSAWSEWSGKPQPLMIAGLFSTLIGTLVAIGVGIATLIQKIRSPKK